MKALLPLWIIGAPFLYIIVDWMRAPKHTSARDDLGMRPTMATTVPR